MTLPLMLLAVLSMVGGFMGLPAVFSEHHMLADFLGKAAGVVHGEHLDHNTEFILMGISVAIAVVGLIIAFVRYGGGKNVPVSDEQMTNPITKVVYNKYYVDELYNLIIVKPLHILGDISMLVIEYLVIDLVVNGIALTSRVVGLGLILGFCSGKGSSNFTSSSTTSSFIKVTRNVSNIIIWSIHFNFHDRFQKDWFSFHKTLFETHPSTKLESHI
jgi:NADH:ubiquinone oxidoreductase subunit 5 (subunit L)/multisubunit Na+/H+ antiporter MnhA subunit